MRLLLSVLIVLLFQVPVFSQQTPANENLNQSLGSVNQNYRGKHKYFNDDLLGNFLDSIGPQNLLIIAVVVVAGIGLIAWKNKGKGGKQT